MTTLSHASNSTPQSRELLSTEFDTNLSTQLTSLSSSFNMQMRQANLQLNKVLTTSQTDASYDQEVYQLNTQLKNKVYPLLAQVKNLQQHYESQSAASQSNFMQNKLLWESTNVSADIDQRIALEQQKFDSVTHLATQSHQLYLRQYYVMCMYIVLFVLLLLGFGFMYYWMHTTSPAHEHSLYNLPHTKKGIIDNKAFTHTDVFGEDDDEAYDEEDDEEADVHSHDRKYPHPTKDVQPTTTAPREKVVPLPGSSTQPPRTTTAPTDDMSSSSSSSSSSHDRDSSLYR